MAHMINKQEEDTLMTAFDALDADLGKLLAHYRKLKRDRKALLYSMKALMSAVRNLEGQEIQYSLALDLSAALNSCNIAEAQAESEE